MLDIRKYRWWLEARLPHAVGYQLIGNGDYTTGELACMISTTQERFDKIIKMDEFSSIPGNTYQVESEVYATLPIQSIHTNPFMAGSESPNTRKARIAVEVVRKTLERAGKRGYEAQLHQLFPRLAGSA